MARRSAVGQSLTINGDPHTVVGVMPADFAFFDYDYEYWVPARFDAAFRGNRDQYFLAGLARLKPGVDVDQAKTQLDTVMDAIRRDYPQYTQNAVAAVVPLKEVLLDGVEGRLVLLMGAAGFVLLIACANLGNLLLARAANRRREMAVRQALGAGHGRLVRQVLAESVWLAAAGGLAGLGLGAGLLRLLTTHLPQDLPRLGGIGLDPAVLLFTALVSAAAGLLIGVFPALQLAGGTPITALRDGTRVIGRTGPLRAGLVSSQLALALMLLVGAGLFARSFAALLEVPPGFDPERLLTFADVAAAGHVSHRRRPRRVLRARRHRDRAVARRAGRHADHHAASGRTRQRRVVQSHRSAVAGRSDAAGRAQPRRPRQLLRGDGDARAARPDVHGCRRRRGASGGRRQRVGRAALLPR